MNTKTLRLNFKNSAGKKTILMVAGAKEGLTEDEVRKAMNTIIQATIFEKEGVITYSKIESAAYIERNIENIFDDSDNSESKQA